MNGWLLRGPWLFGTSLLVECALSCQQQMHKPSAPSSISSIVRHTCDYVLFTVKPHLVSVPSCCMYYYIMHSQADRLQYSSQEG